MVTSSQVVRAGIIDELPQWQQEMNPLLLPPVVVCLPDVGSALTVQPANSGRISFDFFIVGHGKRRVPSTALWSVTIMTDQIKHCLILWVISWSSWAWGFASESGWYPLATRNIFRWQLRTTRVFVWAHSIALGPKIDTTRVRSKADYDELGG